jgi:DNA-binding NarL/FixJ family response regulator
VAIPLQTLARAIAAHEVVTGQTAMSGSNRDLTPREKEVLVSLTEGKTTREIASELHLGEGTVKCHLSSIYVKLGVSNRTAAALVGLRILSLLRPS